MRFKDRLLELRKTRALTQKNVYAALNLAPIVYQRYEYGERTPPLDTLIALADFFDVSLDYLVGRSDDPTRR
ncbi:MAG: helix-turn-helix transcriptional regulator [Clostridiales Family XIII bacterium]|jgi:transcriptional regulator with XRE-family HTH domain|nr:helix-turn-helix transcriptional regulator [Clostridiales Family XIII bacterium]